MTATDLIREQHERISTMLDQLVSGNTGSKTRGEVRDDLTASISTHLVVEEHLVYPLARELGRDLRNEADEGLERHHVVRILASELDNMDPVEDRFVPKAKVIADNFGLHVEQEEAELLPHLESSMTSEELDDLADRMESASAVAPTRPHPHVPDEAPGNIVDLANGLLDRVRERLGV